MNFWRLDRPDYPSDYADTFINGQLEHPFGLPGVRCEECGQTWGGSRILPHALPEPLRGRKELTDRWPIDGRSHLKLRAEVLEALHQAGATIDSLRPGDEFQPAFLDVPSRPEADFLWSSAGSVVVSQRIKATLTAAGVRGATFVPVTPRRIGVRQPELPPPIPASGEPEDLITEIQATLPKDDVPVLHELVITAESGPPAGVTAAPVCPLCGRESYDPAARHLVMLPQMWGGDDIFLLATTLWIVVTDRVRDLLVRVPASNLQYHRLEGAA